MYRKKSKCILQRTANISKSLFLLILFAIPIKGLSQDSLSDVPALLKLAHVIYEPTLEIKKAVLLLDQQLDENPQNKYAWMHLGEALAIGYTRSTHATTPSQAWQTAYELDKEDCHPGALAVRYSSPTKAPAKIQKLVDRHPDCAEAVYLQALMTEPNDPYRIELLKKSIHIKESSDALAALGQALAISHEWQQAEQVLSKGLVAPPLFPEDWRPDGWVTVHGHLGLAWVKYKQKRWKEARSEYTTFMVWFAAPGPWHDLSDIEKGWYNKLSTQWPKIKGEDVK